MSIIRYILLSRIPREAEELAISLSKALCPLFSWSKISSSRTNFETRGEGEDVCEIRRYRFSGIFEEALRLKAKTILTEHQYEFILHPAGTYIDQPIRVSASGEIQSSRVPQKGGW